MACPIRFIAGPNFPQAFAALLKAAEYSGFPATLG